MTLSEALDIVIERTGHERYRFLCLDHPDLAIRAQYAALVMSKATGEPMATMPSLPRRVTTSLIPFAESMRLSALANECPYRSPAPCNCKGMRTCALRPGDPVTVQECWDCVRVYPL